MNVNGVPPALAALAAFRTAAPARTDRTHDLESAATLEPADLSTLVSPAEAGSEAIRPAALRSASLWEMLSPEERTFFADPATIAVLTYRPGGRAAPPSAAPLGQRVDFTA